jgi:hypothetical protein
MRAGRKKPPPSIWAGAVLLQRVMGLEPTTTCLGTGPASALWHFLDFMGKTSISAEHKSCSYIVASRPEMMCHLVTLFLRTRSHNQARSVMRTRRIELVEFVAC